MPARLHGASTPTVSNSFMALVLFYAIMYVCSVPNPRSGGDTGNNIKGIRGIELPKGLQL